MLKPNPEIMRDNPLSKIPTLVLDDGTALFDSIVICEYFNDLAGGPLFPQEGARKWQALRWHAFADGLLEILILWRNEREKRRGCSSSWTRSRSKLPRPSPSSRRKRRRLPRLPSRSVRSPSPACWATSTSDSTTLAGVTGHRAWPNGIGSSPLVLRTWQRSPRSPSSAQL
jgi:hypothetical protein